MKQFVFNKIFFCLFSDQFWSNGISEFYQPIDNQNRAINLIISFPSQIYCNQIFCNCNLKIIPLQEYVNRPKKRNVELPVLWIFISLHLSTVDIYISTFVRLSAKYTLNTFNCLSCFKYRVSVGQLFQMSTDRDPTYIHTHQWATTTFAHIDTQSKATTTFAIQWYPTNFSGLGWLSWRPTGTATSHHTPKFLLMSSFSWRRSLLGHTGSCWLALAQCSE